jgi:hypothetical protein
LDLPAAVIESPSGRSPTFSLVNPLKVELSAANEHLGQKESQDIDMNSFIVNLIVLCLFLLTVSADGTAAGAKFVGKGDANKLTFKSAAPVVAYWSAERELH